MTINTIPDIEVIEHLDFDAELGCEGPSHSIGKHGHSPSEPASWLVIAPCCGLKMLACDAWVQHTLTGGYQRLICDPGCGRLALVSETTFIRLGDF